MKVRVTGGNFGLYRVERYESDWLFGGRWVRYASIKSEGEAIAVAKRLAEDNSIVIWQNEEE